MKTSIIVLVALIIVGAGAYFLMQGSSTTVDTPSPTPVVPATPVATTTKNPPLVTPVTDKTKTVIGKSVEGKDITAYHYGAGDTEVLFIGGVHGGYSWNTTLVAYELMDYLKGKPDAVPKDVRVTVIPVLNPDGLNKVVDASDRFTKADVSTSAEKATAGRFNAHMVDINRNFDCDWKSTGTWQNKTVSGGSAVFSEPESQALKGYVEAHTPAAAVVWFSAAGGVYASKCTDGILAETTTIMNTFASASKYSAHREFDAYEITGDMVNWLAKKKIPAISVLLTNHTDTEWEKNKAGIDALLAHYAN